MDCLEGLWTMEGLETEVREGLVKAHFMGRAGSCLACVGRTWLAVTHRWCGGGRSSHRRARECYPS
jgi:hypothetical protein